jgi:hypothetical protein
LNEEILKSNHPFEPPTRTRLNKGRSESKVSSTGLKYSKSANYDRWVEKQTDSYQTKMGILNEIYYNKPLVQLYGDRYFEFILRNRFQDEPVAPPYIHFIKHGMQADLANKDRFMGRLKSTA